MSKLTNKTKLVGAALLVGAGIAVALLIIIMGRTSEKQEIYREDMVKVGNLTVGITESAFAEFGMVEQSFETDLDFLFRREFEAGQELVVEEVCVSEGQAVRPGEALYRLEKKGVEALRKELETELADAQKELDVMQADRETAEQDAKYAYDSSVAHGMYAEEEYNSTIRTLEAAVAEATVGLADAKSTLNIYQEQLRIVKADSSKAENVLKECEKSRDKTDKNKNTSQYVEYFRLASEAKENLNALEEKKALLEEKVEETSQKMDGLVEQLEQAQRSLKLERLNAQETMELRKLAYDTAGETYDVTLEYWEQNVVNCENTYAEASKKWERFNTYFDENMLVAATAGVVGQLQYAVGETLEGKNPMTLYNTAEVKLTAGLSEEALEEVAVGTTATVVFEAYPDQSYRGTVTEISETEEIAVSDGDALGITTATVTIEGDTSGLFQGMTAQITFIRREVAGVNYISNDAVTRKDGQTYVTVKCEDGSFEERMVVTGFSDGTNVEISEGLTTGEVVCYTIKEQKSALQTKKAENIPLLPGQQIICVKLIAVRGNEITYVLIPGDGASVSAGDAQLAEIIGEKVTGLIPVGVIGDFGQLTAGDELILLTEESEQGTEIAGVYLLP